MKFFWSLDVGGWNFAERAAMLRRCLRTLVLLLRSILQNDPGQVVLPGNFVQENGNHALEVAFLASKKPGQKRERDEQQPKPANGVGNEAKQEQFRREQAPESNPGLEGPTPPQPAAKELFVSRMILDDCCELEIGPAAAMDFHIVFAPTNVGFIGPALAIQLAEDFGDEFKAVNAGFRPVLEFVERVMAVAQPEGIERVLSRERNGVAEQPAAVTGPAANDRLQEI